MTAETVNAKVSEGASVNFQYDFGDNIEEANHLFGADVIWAYAKRALVIAAQSYARGLLKSEKSAEEIQAAFADWKPGVPREKMSHEDRLKAEWLKMSAEDREKLLRELTGEASPPVQPRKTRAA